MDSSPNETSLTWGLSRTLESKHLPELFVQISEILSTNEAQPNFEMWNSAKSSYDDSLLFDALTYYPTSPMVVRRLLEMGCRVDCECEWQDNSSERSAGEQDDSSEASSDEMPVERVNALTWACCQTGAAAVSADVVKVFITFGGKCRSH